MAADAGIQPLHAVEDQTVDRVAGGKRQTTENIIIKLGEGVGVILHLPGAVQTASALSGCWRNAVRIKIVEMLVRTESRLSINCGTLS